MWLWVFLRTVILHLARVWPPPPHLPLSVGCLYIYICHQFFSTCAHSRHSWFDHMFTCWVQHWHFVMPGSVGRRSSFRSIRWCTGPFWAACCNSEHKNKSAVNHIFHMWNYQDLVPPGGWSSSIFLITAIDPFLSPSKKKKASVLITNFQGRSADSLYLLTLALHNLLKLYLSA